MKDCQKTHPLLPLYQENQLSAREKAAVEKHIKGCPDAREELKQLERLGKTLKSIPEPKMPNDLHDKIMGRLHGKPPDVKPFWPRASWGLAAAASLALVFFVQNSESPGNKNFEIVLKPTSPASSTGVSSPVPPELDMTKPQTNRSANQQIALYAPMQEITAKANQTQVSSSDNAVLAQQAVPATAPPVVLAMGSIERNKKKAMVENRNFDANASAASSAPPVSLNTEQNDSSNNPDLAYNTRSVEGVPPDVQNTKPIFNQFETIKIGPDKYQLNWETNLVTKGQILILDSTGNTLQAITENTPFAYDHQMMIDTSNVNADFSIKVLVNDLNGNAAVTFSNILKHQ